MIKRDLTRETTRAFHLPFFARKPCGLPQRGMAFLASQGSAKMPRGLPRGASQFRPTGFIRVWLVFFGLLWFGALALRAADRYVWTDSPWPGSPYMQRGYLNGLMWALGIGLAMAIPGKCGTAREDVKTNSSEMGSLVLARDGVGEAVIVVGKQPTTSALFAAQELQEHVRKITGAILPVVREGEKIQGQCIYVGESDGTRKYGLTNDSFAAQEYTIKFVPDGLILMGRDKKDTAASLGPKDPAGPQVELQGGCKWGEGKYGKGLSFSNGVLVVKDTGFKDEEGTLEAWVCLPAGKSQTGGTVLRLDGSNPWSYHIVDIRPTNRVVYTVYNDKTKKTSVVSSGELGTGWHHVMAVHDVKKGKMGLAVDGVTCGEGEYKETTTCANALLHVGGLRQGGKVSGGLEGGVDELRVSNLARTAGKVKGPFSSDFNTVCLMHLDEGEGIPGKTKDCGGVNYPPDLFDEQGTSYAVHDFLERFCDVRWYAPTELGLVYPDKKTLEIKGNDVRRKPACIYRSPSSATGKFKMENSGSRDQKYFWSRLRAGGENLFGSHAFYGYYDRFWKKNPDHPELFEGEHPEYFARNWPESYVEKYGKRSKKGNHPPQMCYSNPGFIKQVVQDARDFFDGKGLKPGAVANGDFFALVPMDNAFYCLCPECQQQLDYTRCQTNQFSKGISSDYMMAFANKVAREVKKTHPDKWFMVLAYGDYAWYPVSEKPESNIAVQMCFNLRCWPWSPPTEKLEYQIYKDWLGKEKGKRPLSFWFYYCFPQETAQMRKFQCFPGFFAHYAAKRLKEFAGDGCLGAFLCGLAEDEANYVTFKMMDDPSQDVDQLLNEYFNRYYGAAADPMRKMYLRIEEVYCDPNNYPESERSKGEQTEEIAWKYLGTEERMAELGRLMEEAKARARTDVEKKRVESFEEKYWKNMVAGPKLYLNRAKILLKKQEILLEKQKWLTENQAKLAEIKANPPPLPSGRAPRLPAPVTGGDPSKVDWSKSCLLEGWRQVLGLPTTRKITGKLVHDGGYLYIKLEEETDVSRLVAKYESEFYNGDDWEVFFALERGKSPYFQIAVNPGGETRLLRPDQAGPWEKSGVKVVSNKSAKEWTVVIAMPLEKLCPDGVKPGQVIYANFYRATSDSSPKGEPCSREMLAWSPNLEESFHNLDRMGKIVLE